ncbi:MULTISPECIES: MBL fold metallo-hydrolase [Sanguibacteroides]|uniref:Membrane protein n=1 Tax=Sanguibacteroides justesenii TaxID=1547597 RepID=A0A0C3NIH5_9PORP|nr:MULTISPECIES: MBL fold metallo-hydrolase [Sanguibacteroides]KIO43788.1 membrane protein [Sanguibacteroides justesenii]KIO45952.1 membrane protein [Sanguibacteroides justesenii]PXZ44967.1 MBL fold metallo-hydrolase [Sanguibacteroides justesenii]
MSQPISFRRNEALTTIRQEWKGNPVVKGKFINQQHHVKHGIGSVLKWRLSPNPQRKEKRREKWNPEIRFLHSLENIKGDALVWLGHNSFFMQFGGKKLLFDPVFGHIPFVRRRSNLPVNPRIFKDIDYLLISHDHFDHLDKKSIALLFSNNSRMKVFCGLGVGELLRSWFPSIQVIEAGWYQQIEDNGLKITFLPAQHWGKRSFADGGQRLWGAFMLEKNGLSLYYSGDTGYAKHFSEIKELFGSPDYALLGIGAYKPRWFMQPNHISPHDSIKAATEMGAKTTIPMHYGTFDLSDEPLSDPPKVFAEEAQKHKVNIYIPVLGEIVPLK